MKQKSDPFDLQSEGRFVRRFLFGSAEIHSVGDALHTSIVLGPHLAGWGGIPHGGIGMGAVTELAFISAGWTHDDQSYPFTAEFRLGGTSARIGDTIHLELTPGGKGWQGQIRLNHDSAPYLKAEISRTPGELSSAKIASVSDRSIRRKADSASLRQGLLRLWLGPPLSGFKKKILLLRF
jgi:hypothetical protein